MTEKNLAVQEAENTPETLSITPHYILQRNAISRAAHNLSATAQKLAAMATALLPSDLSSLKTSFTFAQFCNALDFGDGGEQYRIFVKAVDECMKTVISVETGKSEKGKSSWEKYHWFDHAKFDSKTGVCTMTFSKELADFLRETKWLYAKMNLKNLGKLQGGYALHLYEVGESYKSLAGKQGNGEGKWYIQETLDAWRFILGVPKGAYPEAKHFRQFVIDGPIKEINAADIGVKYSAESVKQGRKVVGYRVNCESGNTGTPPAPAKKRGRPRKNPGELPEAAPDRADKQETRVEKELDHLAEVYPEEYADLYAEAFKKQTGLFTGLKLETREKCARNEALDALKQRRGLVK
jgi:hypothetical protein